MIILFLWKKAGDVMPFFYLEIRYNCYDFSSRETRSYPWCKKARKPSSFVYDIRMTIATGGISEAISPNRMAFSLLFSAKAAKFFKLKPPQLVGLKTWGKSWKDPNIHWMYYWRCEECFAMKGTKERIFIVTNEASRYSFLLRLAPGDIKGLFVKFMGKIEAILLKNNKSRITHAQIHFYMLSGSAPSLTSFQNQQLFMLSCVVDRKDFTYLEDIEEKLNSTLTTIMGEMKWVADEFQRLFDEDPPELDDGQMPDNIIPFCN
jgi:hypothetical protein